VIVYVRESTIVVRYVGEMVGATTDIASRSVGMLVDDKYVGMGVPNVSGLDPSPTLASLEAPGPLGALFFVFGVPACVGPLVDAITGSCLVGEGDLDDPDAALVGSMVNNELIVATVGTLVGCEVCSSLELGTEVAADWMYKVGTAVCAFSTLES
jgi:hypothetical protein